MTNLKPPPVVVLNDNEDNLCGPIRSRSPHPYAYTEPSRDGTGEDSPPAVSSTNTPDRNGSSARISSESGTEADDESGGFFKGLPAPPARPRKGLRGGGIKDEAISPLVTPRSLQNEKRSLSVDGRQSIGDQQIAFDAEERSLREKYVRRRRGEILRRAVEICLLLLVAILVCSEPEALGTLREWRQELLCHAFLVTAIFISIPFQGRRLSLRLHSPKSLPISGCFQYSSNFDPARYIYPVFLPLLLSISVAKAQPSSIVPNSVLGLCSLLHAKVSDTIFDSTGSYWSWLISILPILISETPFENVFEEKPWALKIHGPKTIDSEDLVLIFQLHANLVETVRFLTTSSLDPAELQLMSIALINLLLFSASPQMEILKGILWIGGLLLFVSCRNVLRWELALARIPTWRFRNPKKKRLNRTSNLSRFGGTISKFKHTFLLQGDESSDSDGERHEFRVQPEKQRAQQPFNPPDDAPLPLTGHKTWNLEPLSRYGSHDHNASRIDGSFIHRRRHTLSSANTSQSSSLPSKRTTPSGRPKRSINPSSRSYLSLTAKEAHLRRAAYATYIYAIIACIVLVPIRLYIAEHALAGQDPFGWASGYLFGQIKPFRLWVVKANLEHWILLPHRQTDDAFTIDQGGWVNSMRMRTLGAANTRLLAFGYWIVLLFAGMGLVLRLSSVVEVDTRRKVFHGLIVLMILPISFIDPCFTALALVLVLVVFLLLDLLRASQVPPVARPLTKFLAPYVDGRDHRGPVIVSHIFLLIGCSTPFWISLAGTERMGNDPWQGWECSTLDISMITGVVCVGMGDAAASLFGRRYGRHKWFWGGGKSIEGSLAFVIAVSLGLICAKTWLRLGGWSQSQPSPVTISKIVFAASGASLTEAVLTGANDNVVVPLILWLLVRALRI